MRFPQGLRKLRKRVRKVKQRGWEYCISDVYVYIILEEVGGLDARLDSELVAQFASGFCATNVTIYN